MSGIAVRKGRPTPEDSRRKLAEVLAVARDEFSRRGYRAVTMRGVAEKARVSTRTLYNYHADKLSLFSACLDLGAMEFPRVALADGETPADALRRYAIALAKMLSREVSMQIGLLVYREGADFPELVRAAEANQDRHLVQPLSVFLRAVGLAGSDARERARLFNVMALSEWQRAVLFGHALPDERATERHAALTVHIFIDGATTPKSVSGRDEA